jgi:hypothetical protein
LNTEDHFPMTHLGTHLRWLMVVLVVAAGISSSGAQEKTREQQLADLEKDIQVLNQKLDALKASIAATSPAGSSIPAEWIKTLHWRSIGPANMGGRITAFSVFEADPSTYWVATASGGLVKTDNNGITFTHQFDRQATVSIGDMCVAPSDRNIVWVGTGEANPRNSVSWGDGVYKSTDGGKTWKNMGLKNSFQIGRIKIHPKDPNTVYVGALGRLYGPNEERGLFKTTDGGTTWQRILHLDDRTGVIDVQMHPTDPTQYRLRHHRQRADRHRAAAAPRHARRPRRRYHRRDQAHRSGATRPGRESRPEGR